MHITMPTDNSGDSRLPGWMDTYGDAILRTCYLLCGDLPKARHAARRVFIAAHERISAHPGRQIDSEFLFLLQIAMRLCPCRLRPERFASRKQPVSGILLLPPAYRRIAVLCLYHGLTAKDAAAVLNTHPELIARRLVRILKIMEKLNLRTE